ncbi:MAG TPA: FUSC family protein [Kineosporiaceae bacterium]
MGVTDGLAGRARERIRLGRRLASGVGRVQNSWWSIGQSALGAAVAWELAARLLHHPAPFFASVASVVCLSVSVLNRLRRVVEMGLGVAIGVGLGDLLVREIGRGSWQLGVVVLIAMTSALLLDGGVLIVNQAALQAVFVAALPPPTGGYVGRWLDAVVGGAVALTIAFVLPADPRPAMRVNLTRVVTSLADALRRSADAARRGDPEASFAALEDARATEPVLRAWEDAVRAAEEISRLSPLRRSAEAEIAAHRHSTLLVDRAVRNLRVALRRMVAAVEDAAAQNGTRFDGALLECVEELAGALFTIPGQLLDPDGEGGRRTRSALTALAARLGPAQLVPGSMSAIVVVAQLRSAVVDLLQVAGMSDEDARAALGP